MDNLKTISEFATVLGNFVVAFSFFWVVRQLRVASKQAIEAQVTNTFTVWHAIQNEALQFYAMLAQSQQLTTLYMRGRLDPEGLDPNERSQFFYLCVSWFTIHEHIYAVSEQTYLPTHYFMGWRRALDEDLKDPGFRWFWKKEGHLYDAAFQTRVNAVLKRFASP